MGRLSSLAPRVATLNTSSVASTLSTTETGARAGTFADSRRGSRHERGYGASWDKLRIVILERDKYLCQECRRHHRLVPANHVDHILNKAQARYLGWTEAQIEHPGNLQSLCEPCHKLKTQLEKARASGAAQLMPEWLPLPAVALTIVCGRPGSGKSTFVQERAAPSDMVLDMDALASEVSGKPIYHHDGEDLRAAIRLRNARLASLATGGCEAAWLIVTAGTPPERSWWANKLRSPLHVIDTPLDVCIARIKADARRPLEVQTRQIIAARAWH
jgi:5-methylcytosine-specific restriction enzyme A